MWSPATTSFPRSITGSIARRLESARSGAPSRPTVRQCTHCALPPGGIWMRIALVSPPFIAVPPPQYGGTELVVAELARSLTKKGHEVVVYATGDSDLGPIEVRSYFPSGQWPPDPDVDATHAAWCLRDIARDP